MRRITVAGQRRIRTGLREPYLWAMVASHRLRGNRREADEGRAQTAQTRYLRNHESVSGHASVAAASW